MGDEKDKFTITLDGMGDYSIGDQTYTIDSNYTYSSGFDTNSISTIDINSISSIDWNTISDGKYIDFNILEKYPTAKTLYNQFISVYNMCEEEEKLNGE